MNTARKLCNALWLCAAFATPTLAACPDVPDDAPLRAVVGEGAAWQAVGNALGECGVSVIANDSAEDSTPAKIFALSSNAMVDVATLRPLDDLLVAYGGKLDSQRVLVDGKTVAIAVMANANVWIYRRDILNALNINPPKTYATMLEKMGVISNADVVSAPFAAVYGQDSALADEFTNLYASLSGNMFSKRGAFRINNKNGVRALNIMQELQGYMADGGQYTDADTVAAELLAGNVAMANLPSEAVMAMLNNTEYQDILKNLRIRPIPAAKRGGAPAATLGWQGFAIRAATTDAEAEAAIQALLHGIRDDVVENHNDAAVWLSAAYKPTRLGKAVLAASNNAPLAIPSEREVAAKAALAANLAAYMRGEDASEDAARTTLKAATVTFRN